MVRRARAGFTLIEIGVVISLTLGLLALVGVYFARGQRYAAESRAYAEAQSAATAILRSMTEELGYCAFDPRVVEPGCAFFLSYRPADDDEAVLDLTNSGQILWRKWIGYYLDPTLQQVVRGELALRTPLDDLTTGTPDPEMSPSDFRTSSDVTRRPFPGKVRAFSVATMDQRIRIVLTTESVAPIVDHDSQKEITITVEGEIAFYN